MIFTIVLFCLDVALMIPAVKLDNRAGKLLKDYEKEDEAHA